MRLWRITRNSVKTVSCCGPPRLLVPNPRRSLGVKSLFLTRIVRFVLLVDNDLEVRKTIILCICTRGFSLFATFSSGIGMSASLGLGTTTLTAGLASLSRRFSTELELLAFNMRGLVRPWAGAFLLTISTILADAGYA